MKNIPMFDKNGKPAGRATLDQDYFDGKINKSLLHQVILMYLANKRSGSASTKTRKEVRGGGRKPWRQKGTGRARVGSIRSPIWKGGGVVFGPHPKQYRYNLTKNIKNLALKHSLNGKVKDNELIVMEEIPQDQQKTRKFARLLSVLKAKDKPLIVIEKYNLTIQRAARNLAGVTVKAFNNINAYDVLRHKQVIFSKQALENLVKLKKK